MNVDPFDLLAPPVLTGILLILGYLWSRAVRRGQSLSSHQRKMLAYAGIFSLGMTYIIMLRQTLGRALHWQQAWILILIGWGITLAVFAWYGHRRGDTS